MVCTLRSPGFTIHTLYAVLGKRWRRRRFERFLEMLKPDAGCRVLDVGGYPEFWVAAGRPICSIDILNIHEIDWRPAEHPGYSIRTRVGDACQLDSRDAEYDLVFSNSVIEHVGSIQRQRAFASELRRVGRKLWVQTPAYECPIEPHYLTPFVHYLPRSVQKKALRWLSLWGLVQKPSEGVIGSMVDSTRLLTRREMTELFPDCEILTEKLCGPFPKSYIAVRR